jgi:hypothetical protein
MAHTPGPWTIEYETEGGEPYDDGVRIDSLEGPVAFNVIDCSAHLIAAAPELLAALKMWMELETTCYGRCPCYCDDPEIAKHGQCYACMATDAIAKAEGVTMEGTNGKKRSLD